ncbi:MAG TPA: hypothetical protein PK018_12810 [Candidatus Competibacter sp.]|nr:hypothetical protein [Candidatus Competibacteraceae bacterium]HPE73030.1 hypothetical protein [Candidatus Competibacter sp.]HRW67100.1 hypothetical protein [Candidatus Competibacter sp.]
MQASNQWDCGCAIAKDPKHGATRKRLRSAKIQASLVSCNTEKVILPCVEGIGRPKQQNNYFCMTYGLLKPHQKRARTLVERFIFVLSS